MVSCTYWLRCAWMTDRHQQLPAHHLHVAYAPSDVARKQLLPARLCNAWQACLAVVCYLVNAPQQIGGRLLFTINNFVAAAARAELAARCLLIFTELPTNCTDPAITEW
jgi:hypothetical protein